MDKYIVIKTELYKVEAESREKAMAEINKYNPVSESVECYAVELDFGGGEDEQSGKA